MKCIKLAFIVVFSLCLSTSGLYSQEDEDIDIIEFDKDENEEDETEDLYYYDWDMPRYAIGLNLNSLISILPALTMTHDIGFDDYRRLAIETSYIPQLFDNTGFKLRATYQKFYYKNDVIGLFYGYGINFISVWEARVDQVFLENTYFRTYKEIRNNTFLSGIGETGMSINLGSSFLLELNVGLGFGFHRAGGSYVIVNDFDWGNDIIPDDPGIYSNVPVYMNLSFSMPIITMFERE